jgi:2-iminoacetate synthase
VIPLAINNVSAFSKTQPGGYADDHPELEQFAPHDDRRPEEVASALVPAACSRYGKTGTAGWDALRNPHDVQCKRLIFLRACTRDEKRRLARQRRFSILPGSAADADQGEPFFLIFALPLRAARPVHYRRI